MDDLLAPPAGWIPPEYRELVTVELRDTDKDVIRSCMKVAEFDENDDIIVRQPTEEEFSQIKRVKGVRDTRDGT